MKITAVIPTLNEKKDLGRTLKSLTFVDEILIVDSGSIDDTEKIAKKFKAKFVKTKFENFAQVRNLGQQKSENDWILQLDADSPVSDSLAQEIKKLPDQPAAYKIGRINIIWGKPILHADWGPKDDNNVHLYHRSLGKWGNAVHELFQTTSKPKQLKNRIIHYNYQSISEYIQKLNSYSDIEAQKRHMSGSHFSLLRLFLEPLKDFLKRYLYKLGFLEGVHGLYLSMLQAMYYAVVNIKLYQLTK